MKLKPVKKSNTISKVKGSYLKILAFMLIALIVSMIMKMPKVGQKISEQFGWDAVAVAEAVDDVQLILAALVFFFVAVIFSAFIWIAAPAAIVGVLFALPLIYKYIINDQDQKLL